MGRTIATFHQLIEQTRARFALYRRALRREDQQAFDSLFDRAKYYAGSGSMDAPSSPLETILLTFLLEQEKTLRALEACLTDVQARLRALENGNAERLVAGPLSDPGGHGPVGD
jgi:hypothetical protein